jgi:hypothetical protein
MHRRTTSSVAVAIPIAAATRLLKLGRPAATNSRKRRWAGGGRSPSRHTFDSKQQIGGKANPAGTAETRFQSGPPAPDEPADEPEERDETGDVEYPVVVVEDIEQQIDLAPDPSIADGPAGRIVGTVQKEHCRKYELRRGHIRDRAPQGRAPAQAGSTDPEKHQRAWKPNAAMWLRSTR